MADLLHRQPARAMAPTGVTQNTKLFAFSLVFVFSLIVPVTVSVAGFDFPIYRLVLILLFFPSLFRWLAGNAGRKTAADFCVLFLAIWAALSFVVLHGVGQTWQTIGFHTLELVGSYMIGRSFVRTPDDFFRVSKTMVIICIALLPFALYEALTEHNMILKFWSYVGPTYRDVDHEVRLGFDRVQGPFQHPIHFGVYCGSLIGVAYFAATYGKTMGLRVLVLLLVIATAFFSLSSGPLAAMVAQIGMIVWGLALRQVKHKWWYLFGALVLMYVVIDVQSNRTPFEVMIGYMALNAQTGFGRILIFEYGLQNALDNPIFGLGFNDWVRPRWMTPSIDMFWMVYPVTHGPLSGILLLAMFFFVFFGVVRNKIESKRVQEFRLGWAISMLGLFMAGWMVHFWKVPFVYYCFLLAAGAWMADYKQTEEENQPSAPDDGRGQIRYSRFAGGTPARPSHQRAAPGRSSGYSI
ncbi:MAG: hypothetical protein AAF066_03970 [Pseudomonadota bacterium]